MTTKIGETWGIASPYPVNISPKDLVLKINDSREFERRSKGLGFSLKLKNSNSKELVIPERVGQG